MTDVLTLDVRAIDRAGIARAAAILRDGGLVAFPTETVYGLGAHALERAAVQRVFEAKGRPSADPLIVHISDIDALTALAVDIPPDVSALASEFWPGPLTLVLKKTPIVPDEVTAGLDTVAIRIPGHPIARAILDAAGIPVAAPSANLFSRPSPTRAQHVLQDLDGRIDLIVDAGPTTVGVESTVLDLTAGTPTILRPGAVTLEMIQTVLPAARLRDVATHDASTAMKSPGLSSRHYSPRAPLTLYDGPADAATARLTMDAQTMIGDGQRVGIIVADDDQLPITRADALLIERIGRDADPGAIAANLYDALRRLDAARVDVILVRTLSDGSGLGVAIHDRLHRAAAGRIVRIDN